MNTKPFIRSTTIGLALAALAAPAAGAQQDLRNADQIAPAVVKQQDLRNADQIAPAVLEPQDLRGPDAIDAAAGREPVADVVYVKVPSPAPQNGLDWADAGIGAAGLLGLGLIALGGTLVAVRRRHATHLG